MAKSSPARTSFNAGEFSELVQGRVDLDRYAASMRRMQNCIAAPQGPAIRRSGTRFIATNADENHISGFVPFQFSNTQLNMLEFNNGRMRVFTENGPTLAANGQPYAINAPYIGDSVRRIRPVQSDDVVYLFCDGYPVHKLSRFGTLDWRIERVDFVNGPFMPVADNRDRIVFNGSGASHPPMQSNTVPGPGEAFGDPNAWQAFDLNPDTNAQLNGTSGIVGYRYPQPVRLTGYKIGAPRRFTNNPPLEHSPGEFVFEASNDNVNYVVLDRQVDYVLYDGGHSIAFRFENPNSYFFYRLRIIQARNSALQVALSSLTFIQPDGEGPEIEVALFGQPAFRTNGGRGFMPTDVGRLIRVRNSDNLWRILRIVRWTDSTHVTVDLTGEPLFADTTALEWQFGYFSDTTGWPTSGTFFEDRLWVAGIRDHPTLVSASRVGVYEDFEQRTEVNEVLDDSALVFLLKARKQSLVQWLEADERGLLAGTGSSEWVISAGSNGEALTAKNARARSSTERGSAEVTPVKVDRQVLYVQSSKRTVREFAYVFEADGYKSPSMSLFASHLGVQRFEQMAYASEPHSIVWVRRANGTIAGLTYNREENVIGWHRHTFGGFVEAIATLPSIDGLQDALWMSIRRTVNGVTRRYIERLERFWDFDSTLAEAHFVDSGLRYSGAPVPAVGGLAHLNGETVQVLADGRPYMLQVVGNSVQLPNPASNIVVGLPFETFGEIARLETGAADGTAQGKTKRIHNASLMLWQSAYGEIGVYDESREEYAFNEIEYRERYDVIEAPKLSTETVGPFVMGGGYGKDGTLAFRQTEPLPFNVIALLPQMHTQDR